jgi:hypothetical protein
LPDVRACYSSRRVVFKKKREGFSEIGRKDAKPKPKKAPKVSELLMPRLVAPSNADFLSRISAALAAWRA